MLPIEVSLWLKGLQWSMIDWAILGPRTSVADEGCSHFIRMIGELSTNLPKPFILKGGGGGGGGGGGIREPSRECKLSGYLQWSLPHRSDNIKRPPV